MTPEEYKLELHMRRVYAANKAIAQYADKLSVKYIFDKVTPELAQKVGEEVRAELLRLDKEGLNMDGVGLAVLADPEDPNKLQIRAY